MKNEIMQSYGIDIGSSTRVAYSPSVTVYPFVHVGYSIFKYSADRTSDGLHMKIGFNYLNTRVANWIGLHLSYKYYFLDRFSYPPNFEPIIGYFGVLSTGLHFHL